MEKLTPEAQLVVKNAIKAEVNKLTYMGINVGSHVTDAELTTVATAAGQALLDFINAPTI